MTKIIQSISTKLTLMKVTSFTSSNISKICLFLLHWTTLTILMIIKA